MSLSNSSDKALQKKLDEQERQNKKSCKPTDNYGDRYVTGLEKLRTQGKGSRVRDITGWFSDEITEKLRRIYDKEGTKEDQKADEKDAIKKDNG